MTKATTKKTIMVVEDEEPLLQLVSKQLNKAGFNVVTVKSVEQALDYIESLDNIDLIWLDHYLEGDYDGIALVGRLGDLGLSIPVFLVSNTSYPDKHQSYIAMGVERYYTKSNFKLAQIIEDVKKYLSDNQGDHNAE